MNLLNGLLIVAAIAFSVYRQMRPRQFGGKVMLMPVLLVGYGLYTAFFGAHPSGLLDPRHVAASAAILVLGFAVEAVVGVLRGYTVHLWYGDDGSLWRKGTLRTLALWGVLVVVRVGLGAAGGFLFHTAEPIGGILLGVGATLIAQNLVVGMRANRLQPAVRANVA